MGKKRCKQCNKEFDSKKEGRVYVDYKNGKTKNIRRHWFCSGDHFIEYMKGKLK